MSGRSLMAERLESLPSLREVAAKLQAKWARAPQHQHTFGDWTRSRLLTRLERRFVMVRRCPCGVVERLASR